MKGTGTIAKSLTGIQKGLSDITSTSLATKAAIAGVIFGLERLTGAASQRGMDLHKYRVSTGMDPMELQKLQYLAKQYDVTGQEMEGMLVHLQDLKSEMALGHGVPEGVTFLGIDMKKAPAEIMKQMADAAKRVKDPGVARNLLRSMGVDQNMFQLLKSSDLDLSKLADSMFMNKGQEDRLTRINIAWKNFWFTIERIGQNLVAAHGMEAITKLGDAFHFVTRVTKDLQKLAKEFPMLEKAGVAAGIAIAAAFSPLSALVAGLIYLLAKFEETRDKTVGDKADFAAITKNNSSRIQTPLEHLSNLFDGPAAQTLAEMVKQVINPDTAKHIPGSWKPIPITEKSIAAANAKAAQGGGTHTQHNVFNIDGSESPEATAKHVQRLLQNTAGQSQARGKTN